MDDSHALRTVIRNRAATSSGSLCNDGLDDGHTPIRVHRLNPLHIASYGAVTIQKHVMYDFIMQQSI